MEKKLKNKVNILHFYLNQILWWSKISDYCFQSKVACCVSGIHVTDATDMLTTCSHSIRYHCGILNYLVFALPRRLLCTTFLSIVCSLVFMPLLITVMGIVLGLGRTEKKTATHIKKLLFVVVRINVTVTVPDFSQHRLKGLCDTLISPTRLKYFMLSQSNKKNKQTNLTRILNMWKPPFILRSVRSHQHGPIKECMCARVRVCVVVVFSRENI